MKYCSKCGKELMDEAVICVNCGCAVVNEQTANQTAVQNRESSGTANCALVFSFLCPIVGLIIGIVGLCKYKEQKLRKRCTTAIVVSILIWILGSLAVTAL